MKMGGPRGGIEPPSREPQSLILPVDDLGHRYCGIFSLGDFDLLAYP